MKQARLGKIMATLQVPVSSAPSPSSSMPRSVQVLAPAVAAPQVAAVSGLNRSSGVRSQIVEGGVVVESHRSRTCVGHGGGRHIDHDRSSPLVPNACAVGNCAVHSIHERTWANYHDYHGCANDDLDDHYRDQHLSACRAGCEGRRASDVTTNTQPKRQAGDAECAPAFLLSKTSNEVLN